MTNVEDTKEFRKIQAAMVPMIPLTIHFGYTAADGTASERHVEPYEIKGETLFAHCLDRDAIRQFKISQMTNVIHGEKFSPRHAMRVPV